MLIIIDPKQIKKTFFPTASEHEKIRKFNRQYYERYLLNSEKYHRDWIVYSKCKDVAYYFCWKLFSDQKI